MTYPRLLIAGTHSGAGKTTVALALMAAFHARGYAVQPFKIGPDFIDPGHHRMACGRDSRNLDGWMLNQVKNKATFINAAQEADLSIIEGMMGLFDGSSAVNDRGSAAELARLLHIPILLVVDAGAMARSVAAMVHGYATFDATLSISGVLFNRVNSHGHHQLLKAAVEHETPVKAVGYFPSEPQFGIADRYLGLQTALEEKNPRFYQQLGEAVSKTVDLNLIQQLARSAPDLTKQEQTIQIAVDQPQSQPQPRPAVKIGVAHDAAFCFYYRDNLDLLVAEGAKLITFSPINDRVLPDVDLLYLGGGYPELHASRLAQNKVMRQAIKHFAEQEKPIYAECGGLMYLAETLQDFDGTVYAMAGVIPGKTTLKKAQLTLGYRELALTHACMLGEPGTTIRGHEFHYSRFQTDSALNYSGRISDAQEQHCGDDGITTGNVLALYTHLHFLSEPTVARNLIKAARS